MNEELVILFLNKLSTKEQDVFIELAILLSNADGIISDEERELFENFGEEMNRKLDLDFESARDVENILADSKDFSQYSKRIIFFELMGLALCDELDDKEKSLIKKLADSYSISEGDIIFMQQIVSELFSVYKKINKLLF